MQALVSSVLGPCFWCQSGMGAVWHFVWFCKEKSLWVRSAFRLSLVTGPLHQSAGFYFMAIKNLFRQLRKWRMGRARPGMFSSFTLMERWFKWEPVAAHGCLCGIHDVSTVGLWICAVATGPVWSGLVWSGVCPMYVFPEVRQLLAGQILTCF